MRHQVRGNSLGRSASHRNAMLSNMAISLLIHKQIKTTEAKAKEARRLVERLITYGKKDTTHARRLAFAILRDKKATAALFDEIAPVYATRQGGYTRMVKLGFRPNDTAKIVLLQLVDFFGEETKKDKKKAGDKKTSVKPAAVKKTKDAVKESVAEAPAEEIEAAEPAEAPETTPGAPAEDAEVVEEKPEE